MKEKTLKIIIISALLICSTVFNAVMVKNDSVLDNLVENCSDSMDLQGDSEEIDSEECHDYRREMSSLYTTRIHHQFFHRNLLSTKPIFNLLTPPPQV